MQGGRSITYFSEVLYSMQRVIISSNSRLFGPSPCLTGPIKRIRAEAGMQRLTSNSCCFGNENSLWSGRRRGVAGATVRFPYLAIAARPPEKGMPCALSSLMSAAMFSCQHSLWRRVYGFHLRKDLGNFLVSCSAAKRALHVAGSSSAGSKFNDSDVSEGEFVPSQYIWPDDVKRPRVCILGGGFGGLYTALRLESLEWPEGKKPQVVLVDQSERFVFKPLLYELLSGEVDEWEIAPRFSDLLLNTSIHFFKDRVRSLHPYDHLGIDGPASSRSAGTVHLHSGLLIEYDWLVLALGAETKLNLVPGAEENALPFATLEDARRVNQKLTEVERKYFGNDSPISVAVVGCGYSGVELAATIAERLKSHGVVQAINFDNLILPNAPSGSRETAIKVLSSRNVQLLLGYYVSCISKNHSEEKILLELQPVENRLLSQIIEADLILWTVGNKPLLSELENNGKPNSLSLNGRGQAETDETLRVKGHPRIFAVGDSSAVRDGNGKLLPTTAQVAIQEADFAGWNLWAAINGRPLLPFRFQNLGEMMTLGRYDAAISPSFVEGVTLEGPIGHTARKLAYLIRLPTDEHRVQVGISWLTKTAIDSTSLLQSAIAKMLSGP